METTKITIDGYLVGPIWWPIGAECWKDLAFDATNHESRCVNGDGSPAKLTLREMVLAASQDGDFRGCDIAHGFVTIERSGPLNTSRKRSFPLTMFPSVADCIKADWDGPYCYGAA